MVDLILCTSRRLKKGLLTHLHLLPVKNGLDWRRLCGSRQQLLQEDQWREGALGRQISYIWRRHHWVLCKQHDRRCYVWVKCHILSGGIKLL